MSIPVRKGIYSKLSAASAVTNLVGERIYHEQAPEGATFPYIIFSKASGVKVRAFQTPEAFKRDVWLIKAVDRASSSTKADEVASAIDTTLDGSSITVEGKLNVDLYHVGDVEYVENDGDQQYRHCGANYGFVLTAP